MLSFNIYIYIIIFKIIKSFLDEECTDKYDCFNCTILLDCQWINDKCINITINNTETKNITTNSTENGTKLFESNNENILFKHLKYLKNSCYNSNIPFEIEENNLYDKIAEKYCGKKNIIITEEMMINGYKIQLKNIDGKYGISNIVCQYIFISGDYRTDSDIYINRSLSGDFLLFYSNDYNRAFIINYSSTISLVSPSSEPISFFYYSNKSFDTVPFIIYIKDNRNKENSILSILYLLLLIFFVVGIITSIIIVRYKSNFFNKNENKYQKLNSQKNEINLNLNNEENSLKKEIDKNKNKKNVSYETY